MSSVMEKLSQKIEEMLAKIASQRQEIESLQLEVSSLKAQNEAKDTQISSLYEEIASKDRGFEDLFAKIDKGLHDSSDSENTSFFNDSLLDSKEQGL
nr:hypothetical protein [uncultured Helicobacter sp.]